MCVYISKLVNFRVHERVDYLLVCSQKTDVSKSEQMEEQIEKIHAARKMCISELNYVCKNTPNLMKESHSTLVQYGKEIMYMCCVKGLLAVVRIENNWKCCTHSGLTEVIVS